MEPAWVAGCQAGPGSPRGVGLQRPPGQPDLPRTLALFSPWKPGCYHPPRVPLPTGSPRSSCFGTFACEVKHPCVAAPFSTCRPTRGSPCGGSSASPSSLPTALSLGPRPLSIFRLGWSPSVCGRLARAQLSDPKVGKQEGLGVDRLQVSSPQTQPVLPRGILMMKGGAFLTWYTKHR